MTERKTLFIPNIHCPTCVQAITALLSSPPLNCTDVSVSILTHTVTYLPNASSSSQASPTSDRAVLKALAQAGFPVQRDDRDVETATSAFQHGAKTRRFWFETKKSRKQRELREAELLWQAHLAACKACQRAERERQLASDKSSLGSVTVVEHEPQLSKSGIYKTVIELDGLTCSSCVAAVEALVRPGQSGIIDRTVTLIPQRAEVLHDSTIKPDKIADIIEDGGYGATVRSTDARAGASDEPNWVESKFEVDGMTCASCTSAVNDLFKVGMPGLRSFKIGLFPPIAIAVHDRHQLSTEKIAETIEDGGYDARHLESKDLQASQGLRDSKRKVQVRIEGMFCNNCLESIQQLFTSRGIAFSHFSLRSPITTLSYHPDLATGVALRAIGNDVESLGPFKLIPVSVTGSMSAAASSSRELRHLKIRLLVSFLFAIPTFVIAIVGASLLPMSHPFRHWLMEPIFGNSSRATFALFLLATPVQFVCGSVFYTRSYKSIRNVWRKGRSWSDRLFRWGSMDTLVALGTTIAWASSVGYMALDINEEPNEDGVGGEMAYFDTSVFLIFFILLGRILEAISRRKTSEAIDQLAELKPQEGLLIETVPSKSQSASPNELPVQAVGVSYLERGDRVLVQAGGAVPVDAVILDTSGVSAFNESSLTGEARPITKGPGDTILGGTTNVGTRPVVAEVCSNPEDSMIDSIVRIVRDAMSKKASIERMADKVTAYFVPAIVLISMITFVIWLAEGYAGVLPDRWVETDELRRGGWVLFALKFAIATLVVACPCGIGLAAPTAQMVGIGLAARLGIVPYGGGEAFQNATSIDAVVFDKTGTLTSGTFTVSDHAVLESPGKLNPGDLWRLTAKIEEASSHPLAIGVRAFAASQSSSFSDVQVDDIEEVAGRGLNATVGMSTGEKFKAFVGSLLFMQEQFGQDGSVLASEHLDTVRTWSEAAKSVVFVGVKRDEGFSVALMLAVQDPPRPEAAAVISALKKRGIASFMCTGDNETTAKAVARSVGIEESHVMAGLLPEGKKASIERLQAGEAHASIVAQRAGLSIFQRALRALGRGRSRRKDGTIRDRIAFCGDGINDGPSLATADVGISMGSGSALAMTSSDFCLLSADLTGILTTFSLARATYDKIATNFAWALVFNAVLLPLAAGAFYFLGETRLPPVWASLAMACSSVSVVCNALLLRVTFRVPKDARTIQQAHQKQ